MEDFDWSRLFDMLASSGITGGVIVAFIRHLLNKSLSHQQRMSDRIDELEHDKFAKLERQLEKHLEQDNPGVVSNQIHHLTGAVEKLSNKVDTIATQMARVETKIANNEDFTRNVHKSLQRLRDGGKID